MMDLDRMNGALEVLAVGLAGCADDAVRWGLAWRDSMQKINVGAVLKSCREIRFEGTERQKAEAGFVARTVRRGREYARQVDEIERDLRDLYPAEDAKRRLDGDLGWKHGDLDPIDVRLDRSMMRSRVNAPPRQQLRKQAHEYVRARFGDLEGMANTEA